MDTTGDGLVDSVGRDTTGDGLIDTVEPLRDAAVDRRMRSETIVDVRPKRGRACPNCGAPQDPRANFCATCGVELA